MKNGCESKELVYLVQIACQVILRMHPLPRVIINTVYFSHCLKTYILQKDASIEM